MKLILAVLPEHRREAEVLGHPLLHRAYSLSPAGLHRQGPPPRLGLMGLSVGALPPRWDPFPLCRNILQECAARQFWGVAVESPVPAPGLRPFLRELGDRLQKSGRLLYLPESFSQACPGSKVLLSSAISGGFLEERLSEALGQYGPKRLTLRAERSAMDFRLPAPSGEGKALSRAELAELRQRLSPALFFSQELCAQYFTYMDRRGGLHFVLFDDALSLSRKLQLAQKQGIREALLDFTQVRDIWKSIRC